MFLQLLPSNFRDLPPGALPDQLPGHLVHLVERRQEENYLLDSSSPLGLPTGKKETIKSIHNLKVFPGACSEGDLLYLDEPKEGSCPKESLAEGHLRWRNILGGHPCNYHHDCHPHG